MRVYRHPAFVSVSPPDPTEPVHELLPAYVPVIEDAEAWASPETAAVQDANGSSNPPAGMLIEKWIEVPDNEPVTDPRPPMPVLESSSVNVPENDAPV
jgi:hypothetical protein